MKVAALSVVITSFDSARTLPRCLASARFAGEVVVVDGGSRDASREVAARHGATVIPADNPAMLNVNKNRGFSAARGAWILSLDSDEEVSPELAKAIGRAIASDEPVAGYWIARHHLLMGVRLRGGPWGRDRQLRLFRAGRGRFALADIHEMLDLDGGAGELVAPILHHRPAAFKEHRRRILHYARHRAARYAAERRPIRPHKIVGGPTRAVVGSLLLGRGILDGLPGIYLAGVLGLEALCDHLYHLSFRWQAWRRP